MRKSVTALLAALMILIGCEYHPYYDGQEFYVYNSECGLLKGDGGHVVVPIASDLPYVLTFYGGKGENHSIEVSDPEILDYEYVESDVKITVGDADVIPASVTLLPGQLGDTYLTVRDDDTGEIVRILVHVCEAYKAIQVYEGGKIFGKETMFVFRYPQEDDVVSICIRNAEEYDVELVTEGTYKFMDIEGLLYFEVFFPADEDGRPAAEGNIVRKLYKVCFTDTNSYYSDLMLSNLNMDGYTIHTKATSGSTDNYTSRFMFIDLTDADLSSFELVYDDCFYAYSARLITGFSSPAGD